MNISWELVSCALRLFNPVQKGCVTIIILGLAGLSHNAWHHKNKKIYIIQALFFPITYIFVLPYTQLPCFSLLETDNLYIAAVQTQIKTSPIFCIRLHALTSMVQASLCTLLGNSDTEVSSWNMVKVKGKSWKTVLYCPTPPGFPSVMSVQTTLRLQA